jgi:hypothetical protein
MKAINENIVFMYFLFVAIYLIDLLPFSRTKVNKKIGLTKRQPDFYKAVTSHDYQELEIALQRHTLKERTPHSACREFENLLAPHIRKRSQATRELVNMLCVTHSLNSKHL